MKTTLLSVAALSLLQLVAAQPHARHFHKHAQRDMVVETEVVIVNQDGEIVGTTTGESSVQTDAPAPPPEPPVKPAQLFVTPAAAPSSSSAPAPPKPVSTPASSSAPAPAKSDVPKKDDKADTKSDAGASGMGISYSLYKGPAGSAICKTADDVKKEFSLLTGFGFIRVYAPECDIIPTLLPLVKAKGMKIFAGIFNIDSPLDEAQKIHNQAGQDYSSIYAIGVGNENLNNGKSPAQVLAALATVKTFFKSKGFTGPVVVPETFMALKSNPEICKASDFAAANCHAFFDGSVVAKDAGKFVKQQLQQVEKACGKKVVITESGWPKAGQSNKAALATQDAHDTAISSIKDAFKDSPQSVTMFSAYDEEWKVNKPDTFNAEQHWGMFKKPSIEQSEGEAKT